MCGCCTANCIEFNPFYLVEQKEHIEQHIASYTYKMKDMLGFEPHTQITRILVLSRMYSSCLTISIVLFQLIYVLSIHILRVFISVLECYALLWRGYVRLRVCVCVRYKRFFAKPYVVVSALWFSG